MSAITAAGIGSVAAATHSRIFILNIIKFVDFRFLVLEIVGVVPRRHTRAPVARALHPASEGSSLLAAAWLSLLSRALIIEQRIAAGPDAG